MVSICLIVLVMFMFRIVFIMLGIDWVVFECMLISSGFGLWLNVYEVFVFS